MITTGSPTGMITSARSSMCASMMMTTPSTASSCSRLNAPATSPSVGCGTGISVIVNPAPDAAVTIASSVRMLPRVESVNMMMPMLRKRPVFRARAALFGR